MTNGRIVVDTNTFVAAGFNPRSHSARILDAVRDGRLTLVWNKATHAETRKVVSKIPPLSWDQFAALFEDTNRYDGDTDEGAFKHVPDRTDRKFAALAQAASATLVTQDDHLLGSRNQADVCIVRPGEFFDRCESV